MHISGKTRIFGIIGNPVSHSFSPRLHNAAFAQLGLDAIYVAFPANDGQTAVKAAEQLGIAGLSVTAPFKTSALEACDYIESEAEAVGAVNTIIFGKQTKGFNTDIEGICRAVEEAGCNAAGKAVAVIGAGGTARAAIGAAHRLSADRLFLICRDTAKGRGLIESMPAMGPKIACVSLENSEKCLSDVTLTIHVTPVGLSDNESAIDPAQLASGTFLLDMNYRPGGTALSRIAKENRLKVIGGDRALLFQALAQFEIFTGIMAPRSVFESELQRAMGEKE